MSESADVQMRQLGNNDTATNLTIYDINPDDVYVTNDCISQIKAAFIYHLKKNHSKCGAILTSIFETNDSVTVNEFDNIVIKIAKDLAEDIPASDPRWEQQLSNYKFALGSSTSMQIIQQLKEKNRAFCHFIDFLQAMGLWEKVRLTYNIFFYFFLIGLFNFFSVRYCFETQSN